jgi:hypothetical protein
MFGTLLIGGLAMWSRKITQIAGLTLTGLCLALIPIAALATDQADQRRDARDTRQDARQGSRGAKVDCRQANQKSNAQCRQDKRDTKQQGRQDARDIKKQ